MARYRLTSPDGATYEVTAPDDASQDEVLAYFQKQVGQAKDSEVSGFDRAWRRGVGKFSEGLLNYPLDAFTAAAKAAAGAEGGFGEEYKRQRAKTRTAMSDEEGLNAGDVALDTAVYTGQALASAPLSAARTAGEVMKEAGRFGLSFGVAGGYSGSREDAGAGETIGNMATHGTAGYLLGRGLQKGVNLFGDYVTGPISNVLASRKTARAEHANQVAGDFAAAEVPEFAPALSDNPIVRGTAEELSQTVVGGPLRTGARRSLDAVEQGVQREIEAAGGARTPAQAGEQQQEFLRRQLTGRSTSSDEINAMTPQQLQDISGVRPSPDYNPEPPRVAPLQPREIAPVSPEQHLREVELGVEPVAPRANLDIESRYRPPAVEDVELTPELVKKVRDSSATAADLQRRVQAEKDSIGAIETPLKSEMERVFPGERPANVAWSPDVRAFVVTRPDGTYFLAAHDGRALGGRQFTPEEAALTKRVVEWLAHKGQLEKGLGKSQVALDAAVHERSVVQREAEAYRIGELPKLAEQRRTQAATEAQAEAQSVAAIETQRAREAAKERAAPTAVQDAIRRTEEARVQEAQRVAVVNERRQLDADQAHRADLAERQARPEEPFVAGGARGHTYPTEFDAAYQATRESAPSVQRNPLGRRATNERPEEATSVSQLLTSMATEARGGGQLPGFKGPIFDQRGALRGDVLEYLEPRLGKDITDRLRYFSDRRAANQFTPGLQGLLDIRTAMRRAAEDARRGSGHPGVPRTEDDAMLTRLRGAIDDDIRRFAEEAGPAGQQFVRQRDQIDRAYESYVNDLRKPLADIYDKLDSVQAISALVKDTQAKGNIDRLRAFYRVVDDKGDRLSATAALLHKMSDDGVEGFLKAWRALTPDARAIMFQGASRGMGEALERLARVGGHLERYIRVAADDAAIDVGRALRPGNLGIGLTYFFSVPALVSTALGSAAASKLLASKWFAGWLKAFPVEKGPGSAEAAKHIARLRAYAMESLGLNKEAADALLPSQAKAGPMPVGPMRTDRKEGDYYYPDRDRMEMTGPNIRGYQSDDTLRSPGGDVDWQQPGEFYHSDDITTDRADSRPRKQDIRFGGRPKPPAQVGEYDFDIRDPGMEIGEDSRKAGDKRLPDAAFPQYPENSQVDADTVDDMQQDAMQPRKITFAGKNSETADWDTLRKAKDRSYAGEDPARIWKDTGWFRGKDGKWRNEIDDSKASVRPLPNVAKEKPYAARETRLGKVLEHPDLFAAYPALADIPVFIVNAKQFDRDDKTGKFTNGDFHAYTEPDGSSLAISGTRSLKTLRSDLLHEVQHLLETQAGFDYGPEDGEYRQLNGEVDARNVERRKDMSADERRQSYPPDTQDVPLSRVLTNWNALARSKEKRDGR